VRLLERAGENITPLARGTRTGEPPFSVPPTRGANTPQLGQSKTSEAATPPSTKAPPKQDTVSLSPSVPDTSKGAIDDFNTPFDREARTTDTTPRTPAGTETQSPLTTPRSQENGSLLEVYHKFDTVTSRVIATSKNPSVARRFTNTVRTGLTNITEYFQSTEERIRKMVASPDLKVSEASDPYLKATLYHGRVDTLIRKGYDQSQEIASEITQLARTRQVDVGATRSEVNEYLQALHAPERNKALSDGAAGMTTARAAEITAKASPEVKVIAEKVLALNREVLVMLHDSGVLLRIPMTRNIKSIRTKYRF